MYPVESKSQPESVVTTSYLNPSSTPKPPRPTGCLHLPTMFLIPNLYLCTRPLIVNRYSLSRRSTEHLDPRPLTTLTECDSNYLTSKFDSSPPYRLLSLFDPGCQIRQVTTYPRGSSGKSLRKGFMSVF